MLRGTLYSQEWRGQSIGTAHLFWFAERCDRSVLYLFRNGFISPQPFPSGYPNHPGFDRYDVTERGREWAKGSEPLPEDTAGYMKFLHERIPNMDGVIEQYIADGLIAFERAGGVFCCCDARGGIGKKHISSW